MLIKLKKGRFFSAILLLSSYTCLPAHGNHHTHTSATGAFPYRRCIFFLFCFFLFHRCQTGLILDIKDRLKHQIKNFANTAPQGMPISCWTEQKCLSVRINISAPTLTRLTTGCSPILFLIDKNVFPPYNERIPVRTRGMYQR